VTANAMHAIIVNSAWQAGRLKYLGEKMVYHGSSA